MSENKLNEIPEVMMAVQLTGNGGPEKLSVLHDVPVPEIGEDEVLLRVKTCGMNNTDINTRVGWYSKSVTDATSSEGFGQIEDEQTWGGERLSFPRIQGADVCGVVVVSCVQGLSRSVRRSEKSSSNRSHLKVRCVSV